MSGGSDSPSAAGVDAGAASIDAGAASIDAGAAYIDAAATLVQLPLSEEGRLAVAAVMIRIAGFAAHVRNFALADDVEIAGIFTP